MTRQPSTAAERHCDPSMLLPLGKTCADCHHCARCMALFGVTLSNSWCDWAPSRFRERPAKVALVEGGL